MQDQFNLFCENIKLTQNQRDDARIKYTGVCKKIHDYFYDYEYNGDTKLIIGSYSKLKNTSIRPMAVDQDVDVIFKIPADVLSQYVDYETGGQSALLQKIREILLDSKYSLSEEPKAWGKVILIKTVDGAHNVELLPAYEKEDGSFTIPNTENGGSWDYFNPRAELEKFQESNKKTNGLTGDFSRMIKRWAREVESVSIKSFQIENFVIDFFNQYDFTEKLYSEIVRDFFDYLHYRVDVENKSYVETAKNRSSKAFEFEKDEKFEGATEEWKKIFGDSSFPSRASVYKNINIENAAPDEEFIEDLVVVSLNPLLTLKIDCEVKQDGFREKLLSQIPREWLRKKKSLTFFITKTNIQEPFSIMWKVRNFGKEAEDSGDLRGQIYNDDGHQKRNENTKYHGEHFVECYAIKNGICVARSKIMVPIGEI